MDDWKMLFLMLLRRTESVFLEMISWNGVFFILSCPSIDKVRLKFPKSGFFYAGLDCTLCS